METESKKRKLDEGNIIIYNAPSDEIIKFNIGGMYHEIHKSSLLNFPDTLLGSKFTKSETNIQSIPLKQNEKGEYIFDRNGITFGYILDFYRNNGIISSLIDNEEAHYWNLPILGYQNGKLGKRIKSKYLQSLKEVIKIAKEFADDLFSSDVFIRRLEYCAEGGYQQDTINICLPFLDINKMPDILPDTDFCRNLNEIAKRDKKEMTSSLFLEYYNKIKEMLKPFYDYIDKASFREVLKEYVKDTYDIKMEIKHFLRRSCHFYTKTIKENEKRIAECRFFIVPLATKYIGDFFFPSFTCSTELNIIGLGNKEMDLCKETHNIDCHLLTINWE